MGGIPGDAAGGVVPIAGHMGAESASVGVPKEPRGPKKPKPEKQSGAKISHVATSKILKARQHLYIVHV